MLMCVNKSHATYAHEIKSHLRPNRRPFLEPPRALFPKALFPKAVLEAVLETLGAPISTRAILSRN